MSIDWRPFPESQPAERRILLVAIAGDGPHAPSVAVGYLRIHSGGPFFVVPGFGRTFQVTHWADVLGDDFHSPNWNLPKWSPPKLFVHAKDMERIRAELGGDMSNVVEIPADAP